MKILLVFTDMVRVDLLNTYNEAAPERPMDRVFKTLGGTILTRCYTPGPDTPRSFACMQTGMLPYYNGCDVRIKWPKYFIKAGISTIFDHAISCGYDVNLCNNRWELYNTGIFHYEKNDRIKEFTDIPDFMNKANFSENSLSFIGTPDYHHAIADFRETHEAVDEGHRVIGILFERYLTNAFLNKFDYVFCFSDHGHILASENFVWNDKLKLLGDERSRILMYYRTKTDNILKKDNRIASITDLYATLEDIIGKNDFRDGHSFLKPKDRKYVHIEDHKDFSVSPNVIIEQWRLIGEDIDIRTDVKKTEDSEGNKCDIGPVISILTQLSPKYMEYSKEVTIDGFYQDIDYDKTHYFVGELRTHQIEPDNVPTIAYRKIFGNLLRKIARKMDL